MLCDLAVHLAREGTYMLRISGKTAIGPSGTGGRDSKHYSTADDLLSELHSFGLSTEVMNDASHEFLNAEIRNRFIVFAEDVQIPFEFLQRADIHLFD